jgi:3-hydroxyacyl-[acyl-carrier protein] dehydratase / trans-2-decenoyl-[acyl-carrier protein] isomerase
MNKQKQNSYDHNEVLRISEGEYFGSGAPLLPRSKMLMVNRIPHVSEIGGEYDNGLIKGQLDINPDLWFFDCHFKNDPIMPGCLGLDGMWQLMCFFLAWMEYEGKGRALGVKEVKFFGEILPSTKIVTYIINIKQLKNLKATTLLIADGYIEIDDQKKIYTAENLKIGLF